MKNDFDAALGVKRAQAARTLATRLKDEEGATSTGKFSEGNLKKRLGELAYGKDTWWAKEDNEAARVELLRSYPGVERFVPATGHSSFTYRFEEWPEFPARQLSVWTPSELGSFGPEDLLDGDDEEHWWIVAPRGAGKTLWVRWLSARAPRNVQAASVQTLAEAASRSMDPDCTLVLDIQRSDARDQVAAKKLLSREGRTIILASFEPPTGIPIGNTESEPPHDWPSPPGDRIGARPGLGAERGSSDAEQPDFMRLHWRPTSGWRRWFLGWCESQFRSASFDADALADAMDSIDPGEAWFDTPGSVLPVMAAIQQSAISLPSVDDPFSGWRSLVVSGLVDAVLTGRADSSADPWCQAHAVAIINGMLEALVDRIDLPVTGEIEMSDVIKLMKLEDNDPRTELVRLLDEGLLTRESSNTLSLQPRWLSVMAVERMVHSRLKTLPSHVWGRWCLEPVRARMVDRCLDGLDDRSLRTLVEKVLAECDPSRLGTVAAVEAVFAALGRRFRKHRQPRVPNVVLKQLLDLQASFMVRRWNDGLQVPMTRMGPQDGGARRSSAWVLDCWSWSLYSGVSAPNHVALESWLWVGWTRPTWAEAPRWLRGVHRGDRSSPRAATEAPSLDGRFRELAPDVLARAQGPLMPPPGCFAPRLMITHTSDPAMAKLAKQIVTFDLSDTRDAFLQELRSESEQTKIRVANEMFRAANGADEVLRVLESMGKHLPGLHARLSEDVIVDVLVGLPEVAIRQCERLIDSLPQDIRSSVACRLCEEVNGFGLALHQTLPFRDGAPLGVEVYWKLFVLDDAGPMWPVGQAMWKDVDRDVLYPIAIDELEKGSDIGKALWSSAPDDARMTFVRMMCDGEIEPPGVEWLGLSLRRAIVEEPAIAERAYELIRALGMAPDES